MKIKSKTYSQCDECTIRKTSIFSSLNNDELSFIVKMVQTANFNKREDIFLEDDPMTDLYLIKNGLVKIYKSLRDGRQQILRLCRLGDILGLDAIFLKNHVSSAKAVTESVLCKIPKKDFLTYVYKKQKIALKLLQKTSEDLALSQRQVFSLGLRTAKERIADFLLNLYKSQCNCEANPIKINLIISRQEISELIGIKQETVVRMLTQLKSENIIDINGREITLLDIPALSEIALHS